MAFSPPAIEACTITSPRLRPSPPPIAFPLDSARSLVHTYSPGFLVPARLSPGFRLPSSFFCATGFSSLYIPYGLDVTASHLPVLIPAPLFHWHRIDFLFFSNDRGSWQMPVFTRLPCSCSLPAISHPLHPARSRVNISSHNIHFTAEIPQVIGSPSSFLHTFGFLPLVAHPSPSFITSHGLLSFRSPNRHFNPTGLTVNPARSLS